MRSDKVKLTGTYPVASSTLVIAGMVAGADERMWFTELAGDGVGAMSTTGKVRLFTIGTGAQMFGIAKRAKTVWAGGLDAAYKISLKGKIMTHPVAGAKIGDVVEGPDTNLWFADYGNEKIGRINDSGAIKEFKLPAGSKPSALAAGPDGNLWITDGGRRKIVKMNLKGKVLASYGRGITKGELLDFVVAAPDGKLYFSENDPSKKLPDKIGRITTNGKISEIGDLPPGSAPERLAVGKDGNVYFALLYLPAIGIVDVASGRVSYKHVSFAHDTGTDSIAAGPDKRLWLGGSSTIYAVSY